MPDETRRPPTLRLGTQSIPLTPGASLRGERPKVDIVIAFDTTGSMSDKRTELEACMREFVRSLDGHRLDWRVSVLPFGDLEIPGDRIESFYPFKSKVEEAERQLHGMPSFSGGGNGGESSIEALEAALQKPWRASGLKVVILLTDDHALGAHRADRVTDQLVRSDTLCFVGGLDTPYYREWAERTGGSWSHISADYGTAEIHEVFRRLVRDVALTAAAVHHKALGSPQRYRALGTGTGTGSKKSQT